MAPETPPAFANPHFPEVVLRGTSTAIPEMRGYIERLPKPQVDCDYYTRTIENRSMIVLLQVRGAHVLGALSGFGAWVALWVGVRIPCSEVSPHLTRGPSWYVETFHETSLRHEKDDHLPRT